MPTAAPKICEPRSDLPPRARFPTTSSPIVASSHPGRRRAAAHTKLFMTGVVAAADWLITLPTAGAAVAADEARPMLMTNKAARIVVS